MAHQAKAAHQQHHLHAAGAVPGAVTVPVRRSVAARVWGAVLALWGAVTGVAPHVLHHVGPLAGAAFLAGTGGTIVFAGIALVVSIPFLLRIYRHFHSWIAPGIALAVMAVTFAVSTFVIGTAIRGEDPPAPAPSVERPTDEHGH